jgi:transposase
MGKQFDDEYRRDAVQAWNDSNKTKRAFALDIGIHESTLSVWIKEFSQDEDTVSTRDLQEENKRLKNELRESQQTVELLKKATVFFAVDTTKGNKG